MKNKETIDELKEEIRRDIGFNKLWLNNKDFKGKERDMLLAFQDKLYDLKQKINKLAEQKFGGLVE